MKKTLKTFLLETSKRNDTEFNEILLNTTLSHLEEVKSAIDKTETALDHLRNTKWNLVNDLKEMAR